MAPSRPPADPLLRRLARSLWLAAALALSAPLAATPAQAAPAQTAPRGAGAQAAKPSKASPAKSDRARGGGQKAARSSPATGTASGRGRGKSRGTAGRRGAATGAAPAARPAPFKLPPAAVLPPLVSLATDAGADAPGCDLDWQVDLAAEGGPTLGLRIARAAVPAGAATRLRLPAGWAGLTELTGPDGQPRTEPVPDDAALRRVAQPPGQALDLRWRIGAEAQRPGLWWTPGSVAWIGQALLPMPEPDPAATTAAASAAGGTPPATAPAASAAEPVSRSACVTLAGLAPDARLLGSGAAATSGRLRWRFAGPPEALAWRVQWSLYAGGALGWQARSLDGQPLQMALWPALAAGGAPAAEAPWVEAVAASAAAQRRFWRDADAPPLRVLLVPGSAGTAPQAVALGDAVVLQTPQDLAAPDARWQAALTEALLRQRLPDRLGPQVVVGRRDEALRAWLGEGLVAFYTHRLLLAQGVWTPDDFAGEINGRIARYLASPALAADNLRVATGWAADPELGAMPGLRGEWLALHWHSALRHDRLPGLDAVLRQLMLPAEQARREAPISQPLALHRLLATLRLALGESPNHAMNAWIDRGETFPFAADTLGPCFRFERGADGRPPRYQALAQATQQPACAAWIAGDAPSRGPVGGSEVPGGGAAGAGDGAAALAPATAADGAAPAARPTGGRATAKPRTTTARNPAAKPPRGSRPATGAAAKPGSRPASKPAAKPSSKAAAKPAGRRGSAAP